MLFYLYLAIVKGEGGVQNIRCSSKGDTSSFSHAEGRVQKVSPPF